MNNETKAEELKAEFRSCMIQAVKDGLDLVFPFFPYDNSLGLSGYMNWHTMSVDRHGFPSYSPTFQRHGPVDYTNLFGSDSYHKANPDSIKSFQELVDLVYENHLLLKKIIPGYDDSMKIDLTTTGIFVRNDILELVDRYIHKNASCEYVETAFLEIYNSYELTVFNETWGFDVCVPILFLQFDFDRIEINPSVSIEKMDEKFQLSRARIKDYAPAIHESVYNAATHMFVLKGYRVKADALWKAERKWSEAQNYPLKEINNLFCALRLSSKVYTGYAQFIINPYRWGEPGKGTLIPLFGTSVKAYPDWFENFYWLTEKIIRVSAEDAKKSLEIYQKLEESKDNNIHLAVTRLNTCMLRSDEQDVVIDATIGLEALLSDSQNQELTHKLAMGTSNKRFV